MDQHGTADPPHGNPVVEAVAGIGSLFGLQAVDEPEHVKRVIAAGGQTVDEPYIYALLEAGATQQQASFGPVRVPEGHLWVVGDSRNDSVSRAEGNGPVPVANVIGKAWFSSIRSAGSARSRRRLAAGLTPGVGGRSREPPRPVGDVGGR